MLSLRRTRTDNISSILQTTQIIIFIISLQRNRELLSFEHHQTGIICLTRLDWFLLCLLTSNLPVLVFGHRIHSCLFVFAWVTFVTDVCGLGWSVSPYTCVIVAVSMLYFVCLNLLVYFTPLEKQAAASQDVYPLFTFWNFWHLNLLRIILVYYIWKVGESVFVSRA